MNAKSTINLGQNAILPGKSGPGEIFRKTLSCLWLDVEVSPQDDMAKALAAAQQGPASSEYGDLGRRLSAVERQKT